MGLDKRIVHGDDLDIVMFNAAHRSANLLKEKDGVCSKFLRIAEDDTANTAKPVDADLNKQDISTEGWATRIDEDEQTLTTIVNLVGEVRGSLVLWWRE